MANRTVHNRRTRLLYVVTEGLTARHLLRGQLGWMQKQGLRVAVCASPCEDLDIVAECEGVEVIPATMARDVAPLTDVRALWRLVAVMRNWQPDIVNAGTPKAGLLGMLAAWLVRVPIRIYTLRGLRLETVNGLRRGILGGAERTASALAHEIIAVSSSLAERYVRLSLAPGAKVRVLGAGASNGVDIERFSAPDPAMTNRLRDEFGLHRGIPVIGFVGRLTRDKGIADLIQAYDLVRQHLREARLFLVGEFDASDPVPADAAQRVRDDPGIILASFVPDTAPYYALMDLVAFPSRREGFPNVPLEAAAAGRPVIGFRVTGMVDAVVDGETGTLVDAGDVLALADAIKRYLTDHDVRRAHGEAGRARAAREFSPERVWSALLEQYDRLLAKAGRSRVHC